MNEPWETETDARLAAMEIALKLANDQNDQFSNALEAARPLLKRVAVEGSEEACRVLDEIENALQ